MDTMKDIYTVYITEEEREIVISALDEWSEKERIRASSLQKHFPTRVWIRETTDKRIERAKHAERLRTRFIGLVDSGYTADELKGE